jgi:hypothetical protein
MTVPGGPAHDADTMAYQKPMTASVIHASDDYANHWFGWFWVVSAQFWPRLCILGFWIFGQSFMPDAFHGHWVLEVAGFFLAPFTTMFYALMWGVATDAVRGWEWIVVALAILLDVVTWAELRRLLFR